MNSEAHENLADLVASVNVRLDEDELDELERQFIAAWTSPAAWRRARRADLRRNLSRRTRLRLWYTRRIDGTACWLVDRRQFRAAIALWRVTGHWSGK